MYDGYNGPCKIRENNCIVSHLNYDGHKGILKDGNEIERRIRGDMYQELEIRDEIQKLLDDGYIFTAMEETVLLTLKQFCQNFRNKINEQKDNKK